LSGTIDAVAGDGWLRDCRAWGQPELYPAGLPARDRLARYAASFGTAELNSSFYRWPRPSMFGSWRQRVPDGFRLSVKAPRGLTHGRRLYAPEEWVQRIEEGWHELGDKRAVLLRHPSWHCEEIFALLERHGAAYCVMSGAGLPCILRVTTDFTYVRTHGPDHHHLYAGSYSDDDLAWWIDRIQEWHTASTDVFVYFNNDGNAYAVRNARTLQTLLRASVSSTPS
jgi:uncharacterized protein YecE (DUF72 family)